MGIFFETMYIHVNVSQWSPIGVSNDSFLNFSKVPIFGCLAAILRSKFAQYLKFSQSRRGNFLVGCRKGLRLKMGSSGSFKRCAGNFDKIRILKGRNGLVNFGILRIGGQITKSYFCCLLPVFGSIYAMKRSFL